MLWSSSQLWMWGVLRACSAQTALARIVRSSRRRRAVRRWLSVRARAVVRWRFFFIPPPTVINLALDRGPIEKGDRIACLGRGTAWPGLPGRATGQPVGWGLRCRGQYR